MQEDMMILAEVRLECGIVEENGFDAPFTTFTWNHWQEMQVRMMQGFTCFQRAIERRQPQAAAMIVLEMQQIVADLQKEACAWIGTRAQ